MFTGQEWRSGMQLCNYENRWYLTNPVTVTSSDPCHRPLGLRIFRASIQCIRQFPAGGSY